MESDSYSDAGPSQPSRQMPRRAAKLREPARVTRSAVAYNSQTSASEAQASFDETHLSSDESDSMTGDEDDDFAVPPSGGKRKASELLTAAAKRPRRTKTSPTATRSSTTPRCKAPSRRSPKKLSAKKAVPEVHVQDTPVLKGDWLSLPFMIWENIFDFVAAPIIDLKARPEDVKTAVRTLTNATRASRILVEPAITARYRVVHLYSHSDAQSLSLTLDIDAEHTALKMRYRSKIETLRVEVGEVLGRKVQGHYVTLWDLIRKLPRLTNIELYHELDMLYTRDALEANVRWKYPDDLFDALAFVPEDSQVDDYAKDAPTKLTSWTWSSRLAAELCSLERLATIHQTPSFSSIRNLKFLNYQVPSLDMKKIDDEAVLTVDLPEIQKLAAAICALPNLEQLAFKSSTVVNGPLLSLLPRNLKQFELDDCYDITAETLRDFLLTHGHFMQRLTLNHCRALSLGFLPVLRDACPALTALSIELKYFKFIQSRADDNEPDFDVLLEPDQVPTWPSALQYLNIQYMRAWGKFPAQSVTVFFKSLTDSALGLPNLRHIALSAKVTNISRADRYKLRDTWVPRMESVFKRRAKDPKPMPRRRFIIPIQSARREGSPEVLSSTPARRSTRIAERPTTPNTTDEVSEVSQREVAAARRMRKETKMLKISNKGYRADNEESEDELSVAESGFTISTPIFTQRLCDVVDIQIDGQNMTEHQFTEDDFLDPTDDDNDEEYRD